MRRILPLLLAAFGLLAAPASGQPDRRVEVVKVEGIIDGTLEAAILDTIDLAEREGAEAVILQLDSAGALGVARSRRLIAAVQQADVPVVAWVGPPGAEARNTAALLAVAAPVTSMAPGAAFGRAVTLDLRADDEQPVLAGTVLRELAESEDFDRQTALDLYLQLFSADEAEEREVVDLIALQLPDLLRELDGREVRVDGETRTLQTDPDGLAVRFHKGGLWGRMLHAVAQPSVTYLLLLLGLVGLVFELFHPSTGPAGVSGAVALGLAGYGVHTLGGSWLAVALIVLGVAGFSVDLRVEGLGAFSLAGLIGLIAGSMLLFEGPFLRASPWVLVLGIIGMTAFLVGAMTRVLRDLRMIARGELEVRDAHPH